MSFRRSGGVGAFFFISTALVACGGGDDSPEPVVDTGVVVDSTADTTNDAPVDSASESSTDAADSAVDSAADAADDTADVNYCATTSVGRPCSATQPCVGAFICYGQPGSTGFCAPADPQCGGFVMKMCPASKPCLRPKGSSLGYCATPEEKPCICASVSGVDGC